MKPQRDTVHLLDTDPSNIRHRRSLEKSFSSLLLHRRGDEGSRGERKSPKNPRSPWAARTRSWIISKKKLSYCPYLLRAGNSKHWTNITDKNQWSLPVRSLYLMVIVRRSYFKISLSPLGQKTALAKYMCPRQPWSQESTHVWLSVFFLTLPQMKNRWGGGTNWLPRFLSWTPGSQFLCDCRFIKQKDRSILQAWLSHSHYLSLLRSSILGFWASWNIWEMFALLCQWFGRKERKYSN